DEQECKGVRFAMVPHGLKLRPLDSERLAPILRHHRSASRMDRWSRSWATPGCSFMTCGYRPAQHGAHRRPRAHSRWRSPVTAAARPSTAGTLLSDDDLAAAAAQTLVS